jgi:NarL family two-component system response regulator LiaR
MVVDDTDHVRTMLAEMLVLDGFEVVAQASNGDEALAMAEATDPDVVVMDLKMPGIDGLETTRRIKAVRPAQPVILYTAYLDPVIEASAKEAGVTLCLGKIDGLQELERQIARLTLELAGDA